MRAQNDGPPPALIALCDDGPQRGGHPVVQLADGFSPRRRVHRRPVCVVVGREEALQRRGRGRPRVLKVGGAVPLGDAVLGEDASGTSFSRIALLLPFIGILQRC